MAKAVTDEQIQLRRRARRRLIGAMALVTVIAVVLPWVLESEPKQSEQDVSIQIPAPDSKAFNPKVGPGKPSEPDKAGAAEDRAEATDGKSTPGADEGLRAEQDKVLNAPAKPVASKTQPKEKPAADAKKKQAEKADEQGKQYVVQVTALADADKAGGIQKELTAKGLKAYTEKVKTASGEVTRVRVGPFPNREAAEKERGQLKSLGFEGNVAPR